MQAPLVTILFTDLVGSTALFDRQRSVPLRTTFPDGGRVIAAIVLVGCAVAGVAMIAAEHRDAPVSAGAVLLVAAGGGVGGLLVTIASPLTWISSGLSEYSGFDEFWSALSGGVGPAGAWVASLDDDRRAQARDEFRHVLGEPGGGFTLTGRAWAARVER